MKRLLLTGLSGFLGWNISKLYHHEWEILGLYNNRKIEIEKVKAVKANLTNHKLITNIFSSFKPDAVIHLAALSIPNYCEINQEESYAINVLSTEHLAILAAKANIPFVFTSTDLVFNGKSAPYNENSLPDPLSIYAKHKLLAEQKIIENYPHATICRMPLMYGESGNIASSWLQDLLKSMHGKQELKLFTDEFRTPVSGTDAVKGLMLILEKNYKGIIHLGGKEKISRYDFGIMVKDIFQFQNATIIPLKQADIKMTAPRPANVSLDSSKAYSLGYNPSSILDGLKNCFCNL